MKFPVIAVSDSPMSERLRWAAAGSASASAVIGIVLGLILPQAGLLLGMGVVCATAAVLHATER